MAARRIPTSGTRSGRDVTSVTPARADPPQALNELSRRTIMATTATPVRKTSAIKGGPKPKEITFVWEGTDKNGKLVRGEMRASGEAVVNSHLRRQGIRVTKLKKQSLRGGGKITEKDITLFTRQLATMMKAGVPLLQAFDIVGKGHQNRAVAKLLSDIKTEVETGSSLAVAFRKHPLYFDNLFCNLVQAGEQAGILETLLDRLATYKEKILAIKGKIKSALFYPSSIMIVAAIVVTIIMIWVIPAFKNVFTSFGADLPAPTLLVINMSDFFVAYWYAIFGVLGVGVWGFMSMWKRSEAMQIGFDRWVLKMPVFGEVIRKATIARWTRTLSTMFAAGVPLVEALDSVGGASGNFVYLHATRKIQGEVSTGTSLTNAMQNCGAFPNMVVQMVAIGEESGSLDAMLSKVADFYEAEVDDAVDALSSLMEPMIMVVLGVLIGGIVVAMYLPIFKLGQVV
jgi:type IV pilus assembly protein PilC